MRKLLLYLNTAWALGTTLRERWRILWHLTKNVRLRLGLAHYRPESVYRLRTRFGELSLRDNFGDVTNLPDLFYNRVYHVDRLEADGVVLDIGANIGLFAAWIAAHNPGRRIICFEPLEANARLIPLNCPNAEVHTTGLGRQTERVSLAVDRHSAMASSIPTRWPTDQREFEVVPLDDLLEPLAISRIAFLKIDTEGMEMAVLDGGAEALARTEEIALETHSEEIHSQILRRLEDAGMVVLSSSFSAGTGFVHGRRPASRTG